MIQISFLTYRVSIPFNEFDGNGHAMFHSALLSGPRYWKTEYEEGNYRIVKYDVNLIFK